MVAGDTSADNAVTGFVTRERITLSVTGSPDAVSWGLARPSGSGSACELSDSDSETPTITPDVEGYYVVTCLLDGVTSYVLRFSVTQVAHITTLSAIRFMPIPNAAIPSPATGRSLFCSEELDGLAVKLPDGSVSLVEVS